MDTSLLSALDPRACAVVEACAGSGKTWLLVSRLLRLLLAGAEPSELLAITYTRKAAGEMRERLDAWLEELALLPDAAALAFLEQRGLSEAEAMAVLPSARGLLERVLDARPGPLITTFHGWFFHLLARAPLSLRLPGEVIEDVALLREEAWREFTEALGRRRGEPDEAAFAELAAEMALPTLRGLLDALLERRAEWWAWSEGRGDALVENSADLARLLGVSEDEDLVAGLFADAGFMRDLREYRDLLAREAARLPKEAGRAERLEKALGGSGDFDALCACLLTDKGEPRKLSVTATMQKHLGAADAERFVQLHFELADRVVAVNARLADQRALRLNRLALTCGLSYLETYQRLKQARGGLDFADAELETARLLSDDVAAGAVLEKLDARWKHLLLDEFQDTNPLQWRILFDWLAAYGEDGARPTVFLVGDPKQSIYRFRRAEPRLFTEAGAWLAQHYGARHYPHNETRRCAPRVIAWANAVFAGRADYPAFQAHSAHRQALPGWCEVTLLAPAEASPETLAFRHPLTTPPPITAHKRSGEAEWLARRIGECVGQLMIAGDPPRPAGYGDITVLYASRRDLEVFERALRTAGIPFLSDRGGGLLDALEVLDLMQLLRALIDPHDDLALAQALKSPLFGCADSDLRALAGYGETRGETRASWSQRLVAWVESGNAPSHIAQAAARLAEWRALAGHLPVHDLLDRIYHATDLPDAALRAVPVALQAGVRANLEAFLEVSLSLGGGRYPSLARFLDALDTLRNQAPDDAPETPPVATTGVVRLGTIHGAKGLESPLVFLIKADEAERPEDHSGVLLDWPAGARRPEHVSLHGPSAWRGPGRDGLFQREADQAAIERLNLLYVAMTRAVQALFVSGVGDAQGAAPAGGWLAELADAHGRVAWAGLPEMGFEGAGTHLVLTLPSHGGGGFPSDVAVGTRRVSTTPEGVFGTQLHAWLELATQGLDAAAIVARLGLDAATAESLAGMAGRILALPELAPAFDPGRQLRAWNEFEFLDPQGRLMRMDRLVEFASESWVLDYKSGGLDESDPEQRAVPHLTQMQAYAQAAAVLIPGKPVRAALVFGDGLVHWL